MKVALIILGSILVVISLLQVFVNLGLKNALGKRGDGTVSIKYPLPSEQKNLVYKRDYFVNKNDVKFSVFEYTNSDVKNFKGAILFIHGVGAGHFYSLPLINYFAKLGYIVVAYDQYASGLSEGKKIDSMTVGARDVEYAVKYFEEKYNKYPLYLFGHSWGAFTASTALHYSKRIEKTILVSGFDRQSDFVLNGNPLGVLLSLSIKFRDLIIYKKAAKLSLVKSLKNTNSKVLYLQGENDIVVNPKYSGKRFAEIFKNYENIDVKILPNKEHTPFVTNKAQKEQNKVAELFGTTGGKLVPLEVEIDYEKISEPDMKVYKMMSDFFEK